MSKSEEKKEPDYGEIFLQWSFPEYNQQEKSRSWYIKAGIIFALILIYSFITANFLFTLFIILFGFILMLSFKRTPLEIDFKICEDGIVLGSHFYEWPEIKNFRLVYRPPEIKKLYLDLKNNFSPEISIFLQDQDPVKVREILQEYLEEDLERKEETIFDHINRWLKL
jgi:hypothetical protein